MHCRRFAAVKDKFELSRALAELSDRIDIYLRDLVDSYFFSAPVHSISLSVKRFRLQRHEA